MTTSGSPSEAPSAAKVIHPANLAPLVSASRVSDAWVTRDVARYVTRDGRAGGARAVGVQLLRGAPSAGVTQVRGDQRSGVPIRRDVANPREASRCEPPSEPLSEPLSEPVSGTLADPSPVTHASLPERYRVTLVAMVADPMRSTCAADASNAIAPMRPRTTKCFEEPTMYRNETLIEDGA